MSLDGENSDIIYSNVTALYQDYWIHIEFGAGNYGEDGHTKKSQLMTVFSEFTEVTDKANYFHYLPDEEEFSYDPKHQFAVLFATLDKLIAEHGAKIIFHVNDLFANYANYAAARLKEYAQEKNYNSVIIEAIPGDYTKLEPYKIIGYNYGREIYDSAHLKNAEISFYNYGIDGNNLLSSDLTRESARIKLQYLANFTCSGLYFFQVDHSNVFIPKAEYEEFINQEKFYLPSNDWTNMSYFFPEGGAIPENFSNVYYIKSLTECY